MEDTLGRARRDAARHLRRRRRVQRLHRPHRRRGSHGRRRPGAGDRRAVEGRGRRGRQPRRPVFPRVHLDADVAISGADVLRLVRPDSEAGVLAAAPRGCCPMIGPAGWFARSTTCGSSCPRSATGCSGGAWSRCPPRDRRASTRCPADERRPRRCLRCSSPAERRVVETRLRRRPPRRLHDLIRRRVRVATGNSQAASSAYDDRSRRPRWGPSPGFRPTTHDSAPGSPSSSASVRSPGSVPPRRPLRRLHHLAEGRELPCLTRQRGPHHSPMSPIPAYRRVLRLADRGSSCSSARGPPLVRPGRGDAGRRPRAPRSTRAVPAATPSPARTASRARTRRVGHRRRGRRRDPGLLDRHQRQRRARGSTSRSTPTRSAYTITIYRHRLLPRRRRPPDHDGHARPPRCRSTSRSASPTSPPSSTTAATGPSRPRGTCRRPRSPGSTSPLLTRADDGDASHITVHRAQRRQPLRPSSSRPPTPPGRPTTPTAARTSTSGGDNGRAYKISYNRPFLTRGGTGGRDFYFSQRVPDGALPGAQRLRRQLPRRRRHRPARSLLKNHKVFLSVGHDEYWSGAQRANVEAARDAGVNLQFLSGNEMYWQHPLGALGRRQPHGVPHPVSLQGDLGQRQDRPVGRVDRHLARSAVRAAEPGRRPCRRTRSPARCTCPTTRPRRSRSARPRASPGCGATPVARLAAAATRRAGAAHGRLRVRRGPGQRLPPGRA